MRRLPPAAAVLAVISLIKNAAHSVANDPDIKEAKAMLKDVASDAANAAKAELQK